MTVFDSYILNANQIEIFKSSFGLVLEVKQFFVKKFFHSDMYINKEKMMYNGSSITHIYFFSGTFTMRSENDLIFKKALG